MSAEWGGLDWGINGTFWGSGDIEAALGHEAFRGLEAFNTRATRYSNDQTNPWPDFDAGHEPDNPHPEELLAGIAMWDGWLASSLDPLRKIFLSGGSDAHGDLNYSSHIGIDNYATDNAIGKVQTVVFVPSGPEGAHARTDARREVPAIADLMAAFRAGRSIVTDGPFLEIGVDRNGDGDFIDPGDLMIAGDDSAQAGETFPMTVRWASHADFGQVVDVRLLASAGSEPAPILSLDPTAAGEPWSGARTVELAELELEGRQYFRAECRTDRGDDSFRAFTNPIWIDFGTPSGADDTAARLALTFRSNPFRGATTIAFTLPSAGRARLAIYDVAGRLVRELHSAPTNAGRHTRAWDGTDASGQRVAQGIYFVRLEHGGESLVRKGALLR
jgi:hypothetical protein